MNRFLKEEQQQKKLKKQTENTTNKAEQKVTEKLKRIMFRNVIESAIKN